MENTTQPIGTLLIIATVDPDSGLNVKFDSQGDYKFSITEIFGIIKIAELTHAEYVKSQLIETNNQENK